MTGNQVSGLNQTARGAQVWTKVQTSCPPRWSPPSTPTLRTAFLRLVLVMKLPCWRKERRKRGKELRVNWGDCSRRKEVGGKWTVVLMDTKWWEGQKGHGSIRMVVGSCKDCLWGQDLCMGEKWWMIWEPCMGVRRPGTRDGKSQFDPPVSPPWHKGSSL